MREKNILIGGMMHETNTFNPAVTDLEAYKRRILLYGEEILSSRRGTNTEIGGFLEVLEGRADCRIVPSILGYAWPSGVVASEALLHFTEEITRPLRRQKIDGVLLSIHGAMVAQPPGDTGRFIDGDGFLLSEIQKVLSQRVPVVATLDLHAVITREMADNADGFFVYKSYPHMDMADRGKEAASFLLQLLEGSGFPGNSSVRGSRGGKPAVAVSKLPLLIGPPHNVLPDDMPMRRVMEKGEKLKAENENIVSVGITHGFMQQDVPFAGAGVAITGFGEKEKLQAEADRLADFFFSQRKEFFIRLPGIEEAVEEAKQREKKPVAIADAGDNIGAGTPGDGTALLREIIRQNAGPALVQLRDPEAVEAAYHAGIGGRVNIEVGGKSDREVYGPPVPIDGRVASLSDGRFYNPCWGGYEGGTYSDMGRSARVECGSITLILTSLQMSPNNIMHALAMGVSPEQYDIIVCKGGLAFREAYKPPFAETHIVCDSPGYSSANLETFSFSLIPRPIYPLDTM